MWHIIEYVDRSQFQYLNNEMEHTTLRLNKFSVSRKECAVCMYTQTMDFVEFNEQDGFTDHELRYMEFLNWLIAVMVNKRVSIKMTQTDLANKVGITKVSMCRIETRAKTPSLETLYKIATILDITAHDFGFCNPRKDVITEHI
jgi:DNA-binding XRE family transcriptional regulator